MTTTQYLLDASRMPKYWYNIAADFAKPMLPPVDASGKIVSPDALGAIFPMNLVEQEVSTEREIDGRPGLDEAVLAPRTLVAVLQKVAGSAGSVTLDRALTRFVESVMHREDRRVLALILEGQGFQLS